jgi:hypothetical protein
MLARGEASAGMLDVVASRLFEQRQPDLALVEPYFESVDPELRARAASIFAGATGLVAIFKLRRMLDDEDESVRQAAVAALLASSLRDPAIYVILLFHHRADVRARVITAARTHPLGWQIVYLVKDKQNRDQVERVLPHVRFQKLEELDPVIKFALAGHLSVRVAQRVVLAFDVFRLIDLAVAAWRVHWKDLDPYLREACAAPRVSELPPAKLIAIQPLEDAISLFAAGGDTHEVNRFFRQLAKWSTCGPKDRRPRGFRTPVAALFNTVVRNPNCPIPAVGALACYTPIVLLCAWIPLANRHAAVAWIRDHARDAFRVAAGIVFRCIRKLVRRAGGTLDLILLAGFLRFLEPGVRSATLIRLVPIDALRQATLYAAPREVVDLWSLLDAGRERDGLLAELVTGSDQSGMVLEHLVRTLAPECLTFLHKLSPHRLVNLLKTLCTRTGGHAISDHLAAVLGAELALAARGYRLREARDYLKKVLRTLHRVKAQHPHAARTIVRQMLSTADRTTSAMLSRLLQAPRRRALIDGYAESVPAVDEAPHPTPISSARLRRFDCKVTRLTRKQRRHIATCPSGELARAVRPAIVRCSRGLINALRSRSGSPKPNVSVCIALLGCADPYHEVLKEIARFMDPSAAFVRQVDRFAVARFQGHRVLPWLVQCWLYRFDWHLAVIRSGLRYINNLAYATVSTPPSPAAERVWRALLHMMVVTHARSNASVPELERDLPAVWRAMDRDFPYASYVQRIVDQCMRRSAEPMKPELGRRDARRTARLVTFIARMLELHPDLHGTMLVEQLIGLGSQGEAALARILRRLGHLPLWNSIVTSLPQWSSAEALQVVVDFVKHGRASARQRFEAGMQLQPHGSRDLALALCRVACAPSRDDWFTEEHWTQLVAVVSSEFAVALHMLDSWQSLGQKRAVELLATRYDAAARPIIAKAFREALDGVVPRSTKSRAAIARWLWNHGDRGVLYDLLPFFLHSDSELTSLLASWPEVTHFPLELIRSMCLAGLDADAETRLLFLLRRARLSRRCARPPGPEEAEFEILRHTRHENVRQRIIGEFDPEDHDASPELQAFARVCVWGENEGRKLLGRDFTIHATTSGLGYTNVREARIFVSPMPILEHFPGASAVIKAIILHEYGHHLYHDGITGLEVWNQAMSLGLHELLNLVADVQLERNLQARNPEYGVLLQRCCAYAFQHAQRDVPATLLLTTLGAEAFEVLRNARFTLSPTLGHIRIDSGKLLRHLEARGDSFARLVRALRMGLGDRHNDPKVRQALKLFDRHFRHASMPELLECARRLSEIFGQDSVLLDLLQVRDCADLPANGTGIDAGFHSDEILQSEMRRIRAAESSSTETAPSFREINRDDTDHF